MAVCFRLSLFAAAILLQSGCCRNARVPQLAAAVNMTARVHAVPEMGILAIDKVVVPREELDAFEKLVFPRELCLQTIRSHLSHHVADVWVQHTDGTESKISVFYTGHNPPAVSISDGEYFYGGRDDFPDGATRIVQLLNQYSRRASAGTSH